MFAEARLIDFNALRFPLTVNAGTCVFLRDTDSMADISASFNCEVSISSSAIISLSAPPDKVKPATPLRLIFSFLTLDERLGTLASLIALPDKFTSLTLVFMS